MRYAAVLNRDGGTLRNTDLSALTGRMKTAMESAGHTLIIETVSGDKVSEALDKAVANHEVDTVLVGGGDGTVSAAAARLMGSRKALAVLPAGTMNLFARGLGIPQSLDAATEAFATGRIAAVDIVTANGRPFVHQFSIGLHAKMVQLRDKMDFGSRLGKIGASARAAWVSIANPPAMDVTLTMSDTEVTARVSGIGITNNLFGEGHLPYADDPAGGVLGIYVTVARRKGELMKFALNLARGRWRDNEHVEIHQADNLVLTVDAPARRMRAVIDGELIGLERRTELKIHPGALRVLVPADSPLAES
jgi:diacylglycerol kinase family enzyme